MDEVTSPGCLVCGRPLKRSKWERQNKETFCFVDTHYCLSCKVRLGVGHTRVPSHNARNVLQSLPARQQRGADQTMKCRYHLTCFLYDPANQCCRNAEMAEYCSGIHRPDGGYVSHGTPRAKTSRGLEET